MQLLHWTKLPSISFYDLHDVSSLFKVLWTQFLIAKPNWFEVLLYLKLRLNAFRPSIVQPWRRHQAACVSSARLEIRTFKLKQDFRHTLAFFELILYHLKSLLISNFFILLERTCRISTPLWTTGEGIFDGLLDDGLMCAFRCRWQQKLVIIGPDGCHAFISYIHLEFNHGLQMREIMVLASHVRRLHHVHLLRSSWWTFTMSLRTIIMFLNQRRILIIISLLVIWLCLLDVLFALLVWGASSITESFLLSFDL